MCEVPSGYVLRTFRVKVMSTGRPRLRAHGLTVSAGDVWCWTVDRYHRRRREGLAQDNGANALWQDLKAHRRDHGSGELSSDCAQDITLGWSASFFEAQRRRKSGQAAGLPLRKRFAVPVTWRRGRFTLSPPRTSRSGRPRRATVRLECARGRPALVLSLSHPHPYLSELVRSVTLLQEGDDLFVDITGLVGVTGLAGDPERIAGVDPGIIHTFAVAVDDQALLVSARALRAEEFLHREDTAARHAKASRHRAPRRARANRPRQQGSRRWRKIASRQRIQEARNRRRIRQADQRAANLVAEFCVDQRAAAVVVGHPENIEHHDAGRVHNRRMARWTRGQARRALGHRLEECGIPVHLTDERGTSSHCPNCGASATKRGRVLTCTNPDCATVSHRDTAGAQNMVKKRFSDHVVTPIAHTEHRRVGAPARRDHRRQLYDLTRSERPGDPARTGAALDDRGSLDPAPAGARARSQGS